MGFKENPQRYTSKKIGSRNAQTTIYWIEDNIQIICGCFKGNLLQFELAVEETHKNNPQYLEEYQKFIKICEFLIKQ